MAQVLLYADERALAAYLAGAAIAILMAVLASLALLVVGREVVVSLPGGQLLISWGVGDLILCDRAGAITANRKERMDPYKRQIGEISNKGLELRATLTPISRPGLRLTLNAANSGNWRPRSSKRPAKAL